MAGHLLGNGARVDGKTEARERAGGEGREGVGRETSSNLIWEREMKSLGPEGRERRGRGGEARYRHVEMGRQV